MNKEIYMRRKIDVSVDSAHTVIIKVKKATSDNSSVGFDKV